MIHCEKAHGNLQQRQGGLERKQDGSVGGGPSSASGTTEIGFVSKSWDPYRQAGVSQLHHHRAKKDATIMDIMCHHFVSFHFVSFLGNRNLIPGRLIEVKQAKYRYACEEMKVGI